MSTIAFWGPWGSILAGLFALGAAFFLARNVLAADTGTPRMREIGDAIAEGSMEFLRVEYRVVAIFSVVLALLFYFAGPLIDPESTRFWRASATGLKDTAGPAINPFIKAITTIAVLIAGLVAQYHWMSL